MSDHERSIQEIKGRFVKSPARKKSERSALQKIKTKAKSAGRAKDKATADAQSKSVITGLWRKFEMDAPDTIAGGGDPFDAFMGKGYARKAGISNDDLHDVLNKGAKLAGYKGGINGFYKGLVSDGIPNADAMVEGVLEMNNSDHERSIQEIKGRFVKRPARKKSERSALQKIKTKAKSAGRAKGKTTKPVVYYKEVDRPVGRDFFVIVKSESPHFEPGETFSDDDMSMASSQVTFKELAAEGKTNKDSPKFERTEMNNDDLNELVEDNTNDKSDDGEGMDKVQPKALNKSFKKRKDKDIDNDGDTDSSDEYLHKRRKAISKNVDEAASKFSAKEIKMAVGIPFDKRYKGTNYSGAEAAIEKIKTGLSDHPKVAAALKRANEAVVLTVQHPTWGYGEVLENLEDDMSEVLFEHGVESVGLVDVDILAYDDGEDFTEELEAALEESLKKDLMNKGYNEEASPTKEGADVVRFTNGHKIDKQFVFVIMIDGEEEGVYHSIDQAKNVVKDRKKGAPHRKYKIIRKKRTGTYSYKEEASPTNTGDEESVDLEEGKMKEFHAMVKQGMTAAQIAKKIGMKEKDVAEFMKSMKEERDQVMREATEIEKEFNDVYTLRMDSYVNAMKRMWESKNSPQTKNAAPGEDKDVERELDGKKIKKLHRDNVKDDDTEDKSYDNALKAASATKQAPTRRGDNR